MHTEEQAKLTVCPALMAAGRDFEWNCRASGCAAWRWLAEVNDMRAKSWSDQAQQAGLQGAPEFPTPLGYCGLAGQPS